MRTRRLLEPLRNRDPIPPRYGKTIAPRPLAHASRKSLFYQRGRVEAGYDEKSLSGVRGKLLGGWLIAAIPLQILGVTNILQADANSGNIRPKMRSERVKDSSTQRSDAAPGNDRERVSERPPHTAMKRLDALRN